MSEETFTCKCKFQDELYTCIIKAEDLNSNWGKDPKYLDSIAAIHCRHQNTIPNCLSVVGLKLQNVAEATEWAQRVFAAADVTDRLLGRSKRGRNNKFYKHT